MVCAALFGALSVSSSPQGAAADVDSPRRGGSADGVVPFAAGTASELLVRLGAAWEAQGGNPGVAPASFPADMGSLDSDTRKVVFIRSLLPYVLDVNARVRAERGALLEMLERLSNGRGLTGEQERNLASLTRRYRVGAAEVSSPRERWQLLRELLRRVDEIPVGLAVGQAAVESAWGTSRLALRENALFGQFVYPSNDPAPRLGKGALRPGAPARFRNIGEAVEAYCRNLNTCAAYEPFRRLRASCRGRGVAVDPAFLAQGLLPYSELRGLYVANLREVMRGNALGALALVTAGRRRGEGVALLCERLHPPVPRADEVSDAAA